MTQALPNTQLYQKIFAEQEQFKVELMQLLPGEILKELLENSPSNTVASTSRYWLQKMKKRRKRSIIHRSPPKNSSPHTQGLLLLKINIYISIRLWNLTILLDVGDPRHKGLQFFMEGRLPQVWELHQHML